MIVWGGDGEEGSFADGAAYDPRRDSWRPIAPAPLAGRERHVAVWTGRQMVVWGGDADGGRLRFSDGAAYDPAVDRWRRLPRSLLTARFGHTAVWTGSEMLVFGGFTSVLAPGEGAASASGEELAATSAFSARLSLGPHRGLDGTDDARVGQGRRGCVRARARYVAAPAGRAALGQDRAVRRLDRPGADRLGRRGVRGRLPQAGRSGLPPLT